MKTVLVSMLVLVSLASFAQIHGSYPLTIPQHHVTSQEVTVNVIVDDNKTAKSIKPNISESYTNVLIYDNPNNKSEFKNTRSEGNVVISQNSEKFYVSYKNNTHSYDVINYKFDSFHKISALDKNGNMVIISVYSNECTIRSDGLLIVMRNW